MATRDEITAVNRIHITRSIVGICHMQVCAESDATDEEILAHCNQQNRAGTSGGWTRVIREQPEGFWGTADMAPKRCADYPDRTHFLVAC